jgi:hypothetical protein
MPQQIIRDIVFQPFTTFVVAVAVTPTQISPTFTKSDLIDSFILSLDAGAANNVFIGDQGVTVNSGIELVAGGGPLLLRILNQNVYYDILSQVNPVAENLACGAQIPIRSIPFIIWDLTQIYLVAAAPTNVRVAPFRSQFI